MVKFTPRPINENVNISKVSPKREFLVLTSGLVGILYVCYLISGFLLNVLIDQMPSKMEHAAAQLFQLKNIETSEKFLAANQEVQQLVDDLAGLWPESPLDYTVHIIESDDANALAMPGGHIVLLSGLLKEVESQNELVMILGHELGHYANRDHLRAMGRGIIFVLLSTALFGTDSGVTHLVSGAFHAANMKFSRNQETAADLFALDLIHKKYGHVAGVTDFFERIEKKRKLPQFLQFFLTHPMGAQRVDMLNNSILSLRYRIGAKIPLSSIFQEQFKIKEESL